jgi:hypothetical protein
MVTDWFAGREVVLAMAVYVNSFPPVAGWLQDLTNSAATPLYFAAALVFSMLPLFAAFRAGLAAKRRLRSFRCLTPHRHTTGDKSPPRCRRSSRG